MIEDGVGAFVPHGLVERAPTRAGGPLAGLSFALKDLFDLEGVPTGAGNPDWLATHPLPSRTARVAELLLDAGARLAGKTVTDEIAWSVTGQNVHYGAPRNVRAPGRISGGSSSGSAAAVAAGLVDFAIGSDTGGSVRLPASLCGLFGLRPSHGRIPIEGAVDLAPSYDTVGWFARDAATFARVARVLLGEARKPVRPIRLLIAEDLFAGVDPAVSEALAPVLDRAASLIGGAERVVVSGAEGARWRDAFRLIQASEAWRTHGDWVRAVRPAFGPGVRERFAAAERLDPAEVQRALADRKAIRARMTALVPPGTILALPSAPSIAPLVGAPEPELDRFRARVTDLMCPAGHAGLPQVSLPVASVDGCPVGLGLAAAQQQDEALIELAERIGV